MGVLSFEFATYKTVLILFSLVLLFLGVYPFASPLVSKINLFDAAYTPYIITIIAAIQLVYVIRMKRPRVY